MTYKLDGTESRNETVVGGSKIVSIAIATFEGDRLLINETTSYPDGRKAQRRFVWSFDKQGQLVRDFAMTMDGVSPVQRQAVFRKK